MKKILLCVLFLLLCAASALAEIEISEVMASNGVYINGEAYDWVELHNTGKKTADLSGCYLSDSQKKPTKWAFPKNATIKAGGYILVYCTGEELSPGKNGTYYASFKISASGDDLYLTDKDGTATGEAREGRCIYQDKGTLNIMDGTVMRSVSVR